MESIGDLEKKRKEDKDINDLAFHVFTQIRKGFISALICAVLKDQELHGYGIIKEIEKKTEGLWTPITSSIYPVLKDLKKKGLVKLIDKPEVEGKVRKIYQLTKRGSRFLRFFVQKFQEMVNKLRTLTMGVFGFDGNYALEDHLDLLAEDPVFGWKSVDDIKEKKKSLKYYNDLLEEKIIDLNRTKQYIEKELKELEKV